MASGLWSLGARLPGWTVADVSAALERREAIRTWPMRGTVHLVPPADAHWMLDLMGVRALAGAAARRDDDRPEREQPPSAASRCSPPPSRAASGSPAPSACRRWPTAGITARRRSRATTCSGTRASKASPRSPRTSARSRRSCCSTSGRPSRTRPDRDEALGIIAQRYFRSHGPATVADLARWTGLTVKDCRAGIAAAGDALATVGRHRVRRPGAARRGPPGADDWLALPGFDEYLLGYKDRSMMVDDAHKQAIIPGGNGVFQATIVRGGRVVGTWKRTLTKKAVVVAVRPLVPLGAADRQEGRGGPAAVCRIPRAAAGGPLADRRSAARPRASRRRDRPAPARGRCAARAPAGSARAASVVRPRRRRKSARVAGSSGWSPTSSSSARSGPVAHGDRDRPVQPHGVRRHEREQLVVERGDLRPVGRRLHVAAGDQRLHLVRARLLAPQRPPDRRQARRRSSRCPSATGPAPPAGPARRRVHPRGAAGVQQQQQGVQAGGLAGGRASARPPVAARSRAWPRRSARPAT